MSPRLPTDARRRGRAVAAPGLAVLAVLASPAAASRAAAQETPPAVAAPEAAADTSGPVLRPGDRIRVRQAGVDTLRYVARFVGLRADTLEVEGSWGGRARDTALVPIAAIRTLERSLGRETSFWSSTGTGAGAGFVGGVFLGGLGVALQADAECEEGWCDEATDALPWIPVAGLAGAGIGALIGAIAGATPRERWEPVPPARLSLGPAPGDGFAVAVSIRVR